MDIEYLYYLIIFFCPLHQISRIFANMIFRFCWSYANLHHNLWPIVCQYLINPYSISFQDRNFLEDSLALSICFPVPTYWRSSAITAMAASENKLLSHHIKDNEFVCYTDHKQSSFIYFSIIVCNGAQTIFFLNKKFYLIAL